MNFWIFPVFLSLCTVNIVIIVYTFGPHKTFQDTCDCEWKKTTVNSRMKRVVHGTETEINEYPMMAAIVDATHVRGIICGATIISNLHVVTAAHCVFNKSANDLGVLIGEHNTKLSSESSAAAILRVKRIISHEYYHGESLSSYDIAIVKTSGPMKYSPGIGAACLPAFTHFWSGWSHFTTLTDFTAQSVDILGWGTDSLAGSKSNYLQKITAIVQNYPWCKSKYPNLNTDTNICTYGFGRDSCQFDSGGPVLWKNPETGRVVLIGIVKEGVGCGNINQAGLNVRVEFFTNWIVAITQADFSGTTYC